MNPSSVLSLALSTTTPATTAGGKAVRAREDWEEYFRRREQGWDTQYLQGLAEVPSLPSHPSTFPTYPTSPPPPTLAPPSPLPFYPPSSPPSPSFPLSHLLLTPRLTEDREEEARMLRYLVKVCLTTASADIMQLCRAKALNLAQQAQPQGSGPPAPPSSLQAKPTPPQDQPARKAAKVGPSQRQARPASFLSGLVSSIFRPLRRLLGVQRPPRAEPAARRRQEHYGGPSSSSS